MILTLNKHLDFFPGGKKWVLVCFYFLPFFNFSQKNFFSKKTVLHNQVEEVLKAEAARFRKNEGQWDTKIHFQTNTENSNVYFFKTGLSFGFKCENEEAEEKEEHHKFLSNDPVPFIDENEFMVYNLNFLNTSPNLQIHAEGEKISNCNYFRGKAVVSGAKDFTALNYQEIYPRTSLRYYFNHNNLKYDYVLKPGADAGNIKMQYEGVKKLRLNKNGELIVFSPWGKLKEQKPFSYQVINGQKKEVAVEYVLYNETTFGFRIVGDYEKNETLIIDPVILEWSTYVGGSGLVGGYVFDIAVDNAGFVYATGWYTSGFPTTPGCYNPNYTTAGACGFSGGDEDAYIFKMSPNASSLVYATYIGGTCKDRGRGIDINAAGEAFVTGWTFSVDFPTLNPLQAANAGSADAFAVRLNASGNALIYSTYIGGAYNDWAEKIAINSNNEAFLCGATLDLGSSPNFPTTAGSVQPVYGGGSFQADAYVTKLSASGNALLYSTYLGGNGWDWAYSIKVNSTDEAFVAGKAQVGYTTTAGSYQSACAGASDVFVARINAAGSAFVYSTFIGGTASENANSIAINAANEAFISGNCNSSNYPVTAGCYDATYNGGTNGDIIVSKLSATGNSLLASTYTGTSGLDIAWGIDVSANNEIFVAAYTDNTNFPTTPCTIDASYNGSTDGDYVFIKYNASLSTIKYATYMGGNDQDYWEPKVKLSGDACDQRAIFCGTSHSTNFPTTAGVMQPVKLNGVDDQPTIFKLRQLINPGFIASPGAACGTVSFTDTTTDCGLWDTLTVHNWDFGDGNTASGVNVTHTYAAAGTYTVQLIVGCPLDTVYQSVTVSNGLSVVSSFTATSCGATNGSASATPSGGVAPYSFLWSNGATTQTITNLAAGNYTVTITDNAGCSATATVTVSTTGGTPPVTSPISGPLFLCPNESGLTFSVTNTPGNSYVWTVPNGCAIMNGQGTNSILVNWGSNGGTVTVTESNACATGAPVSFLVSMNPLPQVVFNPDTSAGCAPLTVSFSDLTILSSGNIVLWNWIFGDGNFSSLQNPQNTYTNSGSYNVSLTVTSDSGCIATYTAINLITVYPDPVADFSTTNGLGSISDPNVTFIDLSTANINNWTWSFGDGDSSFIQHPVHTFPDEGSYTVSLTVTNQYGCVDSVSHVLQLAGEFTFYIPNTFTPNGDNINDYFRGEGRGFSNYHLEIYDRWGERIFESDDFNAPWKGYPDNSTVMAQIDVYVYRITLNDNTGKERVYVGHVSLVR